MLVCLMAATGAPAWQNKKKAARKTTAPGKAKTAAKKAAPVQQQLRPNVIPPVATGAIADFARGVALYQSMDFAGAVQVLAAVDGKIPKLADYTGYYLAAARLEAKDYGSVARSLGAVRAGEVVSPLASRSWILEARAAMPSRPSDAVRVLREHYGDLPQPEGDLAMADAYQAGKDFANAVQFYQRVYYRFLTGDAANRAAAALVALKDTMGPDYPPPLAQQVLDRGDRLMDAGDFDKARTEYLAMPGSATALEREQARVRAGAAQVLGGKVSAGASYLRGLELSEPEADAERWYYLVESARRTDDEQGLLAAVKQLERFPKSQWRQKALLIAANRFLVVNRADDYLPLYKKIYEDFPGNPSAGLAHWKVTFDAYRRGKSNADDLLRDHLRDYPGHATTGAALYFLGRYSEDKGDFGAARACYERIILAFPNYYYAMAARTRLDGARVSTAVASAEMTRFLGGIRLPQGAPVVTTPTRATTLRIERSRLLRGAGLADMADTELRFGASRDGQPVLLGMEMAETADSPHIALRRMKSMASDYLSLRFDQAPRRYWELLFPLPYRAELESSARREGVDPFLLAGLIRQESEFNTEAVSRAKAYGLTQVRPATGKQFARRAGVSGFTTRTLLQPAANLKIGSSIFRSMLDNQGGNLERTLAAYNAGPARAAEWLTWNDYKEPAEFIEAIPFTETRDYVQAVLRNADVYRRLYR